MTNLSADRTFAWTDLDRAHLVAWRLGRRHFGYQGDVPRPRGMLIGEAPGPHTDARLPLFPLPHTSAAGRLLKFADVEPADYLGQLMRVNLCDGPWSGRRAIAGRARALTYLLDPSNYRDGKPLRVLLLGKRVACAWACHGPFGHGEHVYKDVSLHVAWIPHPSGRCLLYNERANQLRARRAVLWLLGERSTP